MGYSETEGQIEYLNQAAEMMKLKNDLRRTEEKYHKEIGSNEEKKIIKTGKICYWCVKYLNKSKEDSEITNEKEDSYYQCEQHKTIFCHRCAWNFYKYEISRKEAPKCKQNPLRPHIDCVYKKVLIE